MIRLDAAEPTPLEIDPTRTALLVIDMQNTWWKEGGAFSMIGIDVSGAEPTFEAIHRAVEAARGGGIPVIWVYTVHERDYSTAGPPSSPWRKKEAALALYSADPDTVDRLPFRDTWGAEIIDDLQPEEGDHFVEKVRYSGFYQTRLDTLLRSLDVEFLLFAGGCTNICLGDTLKEGYRLGYHCVVVDDASRACGPPFSQDAELANITNCYGWSVSSETLIPAIRSTP
jgi:ureidoacrylate peracid hydrolase